jgi:sterol 24-C-methyltransferase
VPEITEEAGILAEGPEPSPAEDNTGAVIHYFKMMESRLGYDLLLGGTKHFGLYRPGDPAWNWQAALRRMEDKLGKELALPEESRVLDAGCGVGDVAGYLAQHYGLYVCGIDILDFNITAANRRAMRRGVPDRVAFRQMSYADLDFQDETFDGCYTMETLVHAADADVVVQEFYRVLKPGARLVLFEYSREADHHMPPRAAAVFRRVSEAAAMPSYQRFEHGVLEQLMEQAGFAAINVEDLTAGMLPMLKCFAMIAKVPYEIARALRREEEVINAMSAVEFWRYRQYFRYNVYTANKPARRRGRRHQAFPRTSRGSPLPTPVSNCTSSAATRARAVKNAIARRGQQARNIAKVAAARDLLTLVSYGLCDGQVRAPASQPGNRPLPRAPAKSFSSS